MLPPDPSTVRYPGPWTHRDVSANGILLHVAEAGEGEPVLLLHGFAGLWWTWHHQLRDLADAGFRVVAVDLRGYGDSDKPPRGYDAWTAAGDVAGLIRALGLRSAHVVGHSWGGLLAWSAAAIRPRVVRSVGVLGGAHPLALRHAAATLPVGRRGAQARASRHVLRFQVPMAPEKRLVADDAAYTGELLASWAGEAWRGTDDFAETTATLRHAMRIPGVAHSALEYYRWAVRSQFRSDGRRFRRDVDTRVTMPVLQLHGEDDPCILPATARDSTPWRGPHSEFVTLPAVGHFPHLEAPGETSAILATFLRGVRSDG
ncbi:Pimeloyl-ACP methyl ester carboxylesterase [Prauserella aidingensis]|uniref:alpha/beta fold hydrolase n=1 Tax=Prauserella aidingensis TaxID=387890 RepID=UPI0020A2D9FC|nr:alpha/beta hydrolase [Prauserella aidingensis]MCP2251787.1 Pimeloyl-ACP methyl ester carboxylesterase [Prauserella aidingensis]